MLRVAPAATDVSKNLAQKTRLGEDNMNTSQQFENKIAIVTGSTQGLGEATARLFAERGAAGIVITGRDRTRGEAVADSLDNGSCRAICRDRNQRGIFDAVARLGLPPSRTEDYDVRSA